MRLIKKAGIIILGISLLMAKPVFAGMQKSNVVSWVYDTQNKAWKAYKDGILQTSWLYWNGSWYYLDAVNGEMKKSWLQLADGSRYFLSEKPDQSEGQMLKGWHWLGGYCYYFSESAGKDEGKLMTSTLIEGKYLVDASGRWINESGMPYRQTITDTASSARKGLSTGGGGTAVKRTGGSLKRGSGGSSGGSAGGSSRGGSSGLSGSSSKRESGSDSKLLENLESRQEEKEIPKDILIGNENIGNEHTDNPQESPQDIGKATEPQGQTEENPFIESQETDKTTESQEADTGIENQEADKATESQEADKGIESQEADKGIESQEADKARESQEADKARESQEADKATESQEADKATESQEADKGIESQEADKGIESQEADKATESQEADKGAESQEADKATESQEADKATEKEKPDTDTIEEKQPEATEEKQLEATEEKQPEATEEKQPEALEEKQPAAPEDKQPEAPEETQPDKDTIAEKQPDIMIEKNNNISTYTTETGEERRILWVKGVEPLAMGTDGIFTKEVTGSYVEYILPYTANQAWYDVNKNTSGSLQDLNLCFAAVSSNMLHWWLEQNGEYIEKYLTMGAESRKDEASELQNLERYVNSFASQQSSKIFDMFKYYYGYRKDGYVSTILLDWFINGYTPSKTGAINRENPDFVPDKRLGFFYPVFKEKLLTRKMFSGNYESFSDLVKDALEKGQILGVEHHFALYGTTHIITLWGAEFDDAGKLRAIYVTDSDDNNREEEIGMKRYAITKDSAGYPRLNNNTAGNSYGARLEYVHTLDLGTAYWEAYFRVAGE